MSKLRDFIKGHHTLRVSILTLYLSLFSFAFLCVILFTYFKNHQSILNFSFGITERVSSIVTEKLHSLIQDAEHFPEIGANIFTKPEDISPEDERLIAYMLNSLKFDSDLSKFSIGTEQGNFISISNLALTEETHYITDPTRPLPDDAVYALLIVDRSTTPPTNTWYYKNALFKTIDSEVLKKDVFDPRSRPWYIGAVEAHGLFTTGVYSFFPSHEEGFSIGFPIYSESKELIGAIGADISLVLLSKFLESQNISPSGKAFIVNNTGKILTPYNPEIKQKYQGLVYATYQEFLSTRDSADIIKYEGKKYISYVTDLPIIGGLDWDIVVVAPHSDFFGELISTQLQIVGISLLIMLFTSFLIAYFSKRISKPIVTLSKEIDKIKRLELDSNVRVRSKIKEIVQMNQSIQSLRLAFHSFVRYVPKKIVMDLIERGKEIGLGGEKKELTIFFSDINDFTRAAEAYPTSLIMQTLNQYFDDLSKVILEQEGTIDKYIGDGIMAFWGAPVDVPDHAKRACVTALLCQLHVQQLNKKFRAENKPEFFTRIGISTGTVILGNVGTAERFNYTVIGDTVNATARVQNINKKFKTQIIITDETYQHIGKSFLVRPLDFIEVKGKKNKLKIYELVASLEKDYPAIQAQPKQIQLCTLFTEAYDLFQQQRGAEAKRAFEHILELFPDDEPTKIYLESGY